MTPYHVWVVEVKYSEKWSIEFMAHTREEARRIPVINWIPKGQYRIRKYFPKERK